MIRLDSQYSVKIHQGDVVGYLGARDFILIKRSPLYQNEKEEKIQPIGDNPTFLRADMPSNVKVTIVEGQHKLVILAGDDVYFYETGNRSFERIKPGTFFQILSNI